MPVEQEITSGLYNKALIVNSSDGARTAVTLWASPSTHRLLVDAGTITTSSASVGVTGALVPASADYIGFNSGGNLVGVSLGQQTAANSIPVILPSATITTLTPPSNTGYALDATLTGGNVIVKQATAANFNATVVGTGTFVTQATLAAETTKVIGTVNIATAQTIAVTNTGTFAVQSTPVTQADTFMLGGVNIKEINAVTPLMGNGTTGTGSLRVTHASDNTGIANWGHGATAVTVPAGATYAGVRGTTALPTAVTDGQMVGAMGDKFGRQVVLPHGMRDIILPITQLTLTSTTTETSLIAAVASTFNDILTLVVINTSATATQVDFRDSTAGTIRLSLYIPAGETRGVSMNGILPQNAVNTAWSAKCGTSVASVIITGTYVANK